ncbi:hypothetical protein PR048_030335 [Dryococelus australis]|uniref:Uncharacterized protein n=1 Tax=Dryococelus australis TaxID=614101 RepID=A0ABQ9G8P9_9NEOP|nr:hypothetical protein PR048_030335 [Dryococelus australis]
MLNSRRWWFSGVTESTLLVYPAAYLVPVTALRRRGAYVGAMELPTLWNSRGHSRVSRVGEGEIRGGVRAITSRGGALQVSTRVWCPRAESRGCCHAEVGPDHSRRPGDCELGSAKGGDDSVILHAASSKNETTVISARDTDTIFFWSITTIGFSVGRCEFRQGRQQRRTIFLSICLEKTRQHNKSKIIGILFSHRKLCDFRNGHDNETCYMENPYCTQQASQQFWQCVPDYRSRDICIALHYQTPQYLSWSALALEAHKRRPVSHLSEEQKNGQVVIPPVILQSPIIDSRKENPYLIYLTSKVWRRIVDSVFQGGQFDESSLMLTGQVIGLPIIDCVKRMIPYFHASDHFPYAKYSQLYVQVMMDLSSKITADEYHIFT